MRNRCRVAGDCARRRHARLRLAHYVERPLEFGAARVKDVSPQPGNALLERDFIDLARKLDA